MGIRGTVEERVLEALEKEQGIVMVNRLRQAGLNPALIGTIVRIYTKILAEDCNATTLECLRGVPVDPRDAFIGPRPGCA